MTYRNLRYPMKPWLPCYVVMLSRNSFEWIHVICAWWVPEVKIEDTENVEKMTVDRIPVSTL